jgi:hypothetical protein
MGRVGSNKCVQPTPLRGWYRGENWLCDAARIEADLGKLAVRLTLVVRRCLQSRFDQQYDTIKRDDKLSGNEWRELAIQLFPERVDLYKQESETVWFVLFDLLSDVVDAHDTQNVEELTRIYKFAEWCHGQKDIDPETWTAALVAFYEHLIDGEVVLHAIPRWVKPTTFKDLTPTLRERLGQEQYQQLLTEYNHVNGTDFE